MTKAALRKYYRSKRRELTSAEINYASQSIAQRFFEYFALQSNERIHCFLPIPQKNEVNTFYLIDRLRDQYPDITLIIPKILGEELTHYSWKAEETLTENTWGILEPAAGEPIVADAIDLIIVPLLVADKTGHRVGYGKGFYDRFLSLCRPDAVKVGLSFWAPVEAIDDVAPWDIPLNFLITPNTVWEF